MIAIKHIIPLFILLSFCLQTRAQDLAFETKNSLLGLGIGFGWQPTNYNRDVSQIPAIVLSYEKGLLYLNKAGWVGLGFTTAYNYVYFNYSGSADRAQWQNLMLALRGTFHPRMLMTQYFDTYIGFNAGAKYQFYSDDFLARINQLPTNYGGLRDMFSGFAGMRIYPSERMALFAEAGYGFAYVTIGVNWKFGERNIQADPKIIRRGISRPGR